MQGFINHPLSDGNFIFLGHLPDALLPSDAQFDALWSLHPPEPPKIKMLGRMVSIPRFQRAYGKDYAFSGQVSEAYLIPEVMTPYLEWAQKNIDSRLNGLLVNWYDAELWHYLGAHRDSTKNMSIGCPIVTISLGQTRVFRLTQGRSKLDLSVENGDVLVLPYKSNLVWKHQITKTKKTGKRISITMRGFKT